MRIVDQQFARTQSTYCVSLSVLSVTLSKAFWSWGMVSMSWPWRHRSRLGRKNASSEHMPDTLQLKRACRTGTRGSR